jgi:hypothetical protein
MAPTKFRKRHLRECARLALEGRGIQAEVKPGPGIVPGARLLTMAGSEEREVAVRTSLDREVGLTRHPDGRWMTIPNVDEVVVAVPSAEEPDSAEVLCFDSDVMIEAFDAALAARMKQDSKLSHKAPIFIALDHSAKGSSPNLQSGLKTKSKWRTLIPLSAVSMPSLARPSAEGFIDRVKREFAELNGVDVSKVVVEFRIIA